MPMPDGKTMIGVYCSAALKEHATNREILHEVGVIFIELLGRLRPAQDRAWTEHLLEKYPLGNEFLMEIVERYAKKST